MSRCLQFDKLIAVARGKLLSLDASTWWPDRTC